MTKCDQGMGGQISSKSRDVFHGRPLISLFGRIPAIRPNIDYVRMLASVPGNKGDMDENKQEEGNENKERD